MKKNFNLGCTESGYIYDDSVIYEWTKKNREMPVFDPGISLTLMLGHYGQATMLNEHHSEQLSSWLTGEGETLDGGIVSLACCAPYDALAPSELPFTKVLSSSGVDVLSLMPGFLYDLKGKRVVLDTPEARGGNRSNPLIQVPLEDLVHRIQVSSSSQVATLMDSPYFDKALETALMFAPGTKDF